MQSGITREGKEAFGEWVRRTRTSSAIRELVSDWLKSTNPSEYPSEPISQGQFARWITSQTGFRVSEAAIGRLERGDKRSAPPVEILVAITQRLKILQLPDGNYCTLDDAIAVLTGELNPFTGERHKHSNGAIS